jgi:hypothetical protein
VRPEEVFSLFFHSITKPTENLDKVAKPSRHDHRFPFMLHFISLYGSRRALINFHFVIFFHFHNDRNSATSSGAMMPWLLLAIVFAVLPASSSAETIAASDFRFISYHGELVNAMVRAPIKRRRRRIARSESAPEQRFYCCLTSLIKYAAMLINSDSLTSQLVRSTLIDFLKLFQFLNSTFFFSSFSFGSQMQIYWRRRADSPITT